MRLFEQNTAVLYQSTKENDDRNGKRGIIRSDRMITPDGGVYMVWFEDLTARWNCHEDYLTEEIESTLSDNAIETNLIDDPVNVQAVEIPEVSLNTLTLPAIADNLSYIPLTIKFDKPKFIKYANAITSKFKGLVLTDENEAEIKSISANLGKIQKELNSKRIEVETEIAAPVRMLKNDVDEVIAIFAKAQLELKTQLEESANKRRSQKRKEVQLILDGFIKVSTLPEEYKSKVILKPDYLLAKYTPKKIREDIEGQLQEQQEYYNNALAVKELEKAKLQAKEQVFNALKIAFSDFNHLSLSDVFDIETDQLAAWFKTKDEARLAKIVTEAKQAELVIPKPIEFPHVDQLKDNFGGSPSYSFSELIAKQEIEVPDLQALTFNKELNGELCEIAAEVSKQHLINANIETPHQNTTTVLLLRIEDSNEEIVYTAALEMIALAERMHVVVSLVEND